MCGDALRRTEIALGLTQVSEVQGTVGRSSSQNVHIMRSRESTMAMALI